MYRRCFNLCIVIGHPPIFLMISTEKVLILYLGKCIKCHHILEGGSLHSHCYENLKSYRTRTTFVCSVTNFLDTDGGDILENHSEI